MKTWCRQYRTWLLLGGIVLIGFGLRVYNLGENSFVADEFLDINSSYGYSQTGTWKAWDFNYDVPATQNQNDARDERAAVYKWQVAQVFKIMPPTEANARLVSVLWGVISILLLFFVAQYFTRSKEVGLWAAFLFAFSVSAIIFDRRLRMYAMFLPVYLAFATSLYAFFEHAYRGKIAIIQRAWERLGVNIIFLVPMLALGWVAFATHQITLTIVPVFGVYLAVQAVLHWRAGDKKNKYSILTLIGMLSMLGIFVTGLWSKLSYLFVFFDNHYSYLGYVFGDFAHPLLGALLVVSGAWMLIKDSKTQKQGLWLTLSLAVPLAMSIWLWHRNAGPQYIFFAQSFTFILAAMGIATVRQLCVERFTEYRHISLGIIVVMLILLPNYAYFQEENNTYHETSSGGNPNYRKVFTYFKKQYELGEVLVTRNFRNYYWAGLEVPVYDFGGELSEHNLRLEELRVIQAEHPRGWVIVSENDEDYLSKEVKEELGKMERISNSQVRGAIKVYRWGPDTAIK